MTNTTGARPQTDAELDALADVFADDALTASTTDVWTHPDLTGLIAAVQAKRDAEATVIAQVSRARDRKVPWTMIAAVLGVSHQAAMKRFKPLLTPTTRG